MAVVLSGPPKGMEMADPICIEHTGEGGVCGHREEQHSVVRINSIPSSWCHGCSLSMQGEGDAQPEHPYRPGTRCGMCGGAGDLPVVTFVEHEMIATNLVEPCPTCNGSKYVDA